MAVTGRAVLDVVAVIVDVGLTLENAPVFQSQVGDQLLALSALGFRAGLIAVSREPEKFEQAIGARLRAAGVDITLVPQKGFLPDLLGVAAGLRRLRRRADVRNAYVRGLWGAVAIALAGGGTRYVYDVRGALGDEARSVGASAWKLAIYRALEGFGIRHASAVTAVSRPLAQLVEQERGVRLKAVVPCCIDIAAATAPYAAAAALRAELGFDASHQVLVYSGGLSHYQQVPAMLSLWRQLLSEPHLRFLLLTNESPHSAPALVGDLSDFGTRLVHRSLKRQQVPAALAACDLAFMLRDDRELNRVASPVKFPEYLAAGLAVVASPGTGDVSSYIEERGVGALVAPTELTAGADSVRSLLRELQADRAAFTQRSRALARERFAWQAHEATFRSLYS